MSPCSTVQDRQDSNKLYAPIQINALPFTCNDAKAGKEKNLLKADKFNSSPDKVRE